MCHKGTAFFLNNKIFTLKSENMNLFFVKFVYVKKKSYLCSDILWSITNWIQTVSAKTH